MVFFFSSLTADLFAILAIVIGVGYLYIQNVFNYWNKLGVETLKPGFPFGNFQPAFLQQKSFADLMIEIYTSSTKPFIGIFTGVRPTLFVRDPELLRQVLIKDFTSFQDRGLYCDEIHDPLSGNLFFLGGEKWRNLRGKLSPTFTSGKLKAMFSTLVQCGDSLNEHVNKAAERHEIIEMRELLAQYTTNIIASVAFGIDIDCIKNPNDEFRRIGRKIFEPTIRNGFRGALSFLFPSLPVKLKMKSFDQDVEDFIISLVKQNMDLREKNNISRKDFFQFLVQLRNTGTIQVDGLWDTKITNDENLKKLSINECAAQSFVFFAAGFETSSSTMSYALYELAKNPEIQRRTQKEIDEIFKKHNGEWTFDAITEMKYLDCVIDEALRKYPPLPLLNRESNREWTIPNTNIKIPAGTPIIIPAYPIQYDEKYYPNPQKFDPERFTPENSSHKTFIDMPYMAFGEGPRNCVGMRMGKLQSKVGLVLLLKSYWFDLAGNTKNELKMSIRSFLLAPEGGIQLKVSKR